MDIYNEIGVKKVINCLGNSTVLGGNTASGEVKEAIESASQNYVSMEDLTNKCNDLVAKLIGSESALITPGAAAGLTLATAGAMTGKNKNLIEVPCHRIVKSDGSIGKYVNGSLAKKELLINEGLTIKDNKIIDFEEKLYKFEK